MTVETMGAAGPLVSVVVPTYNRTDYLAAALNSAVRQTYTNIEILVADDASPQDVFGAVIAGLADARIKYRRNPINLGMAKNTWQALVRASGKYVATLHDDDIWEPDFLSTLVPALEQDDSLSVAFCDHHVIDRHGVLDPAAADAHQRLFHRDRLQRGTVRPFMEAAVAWQAVPAAMAALFRKSSIAWDDFPSEVGTFYDIWLAYLAARTGAGAHYEPRRLTRYRVHGQSETGFLASPQGRLKAMRQWEFMFRRFLEDPALGEIRTTLEGLYARKVIALAGALIDAGSGDEVCEVLREAHRRAPRAELKAAMVLALLPAGASRGLMSTARRLRSLVSIKR